MPKPKPSRDAETAHRVLRHWHDAVPNDRLAHLVKDTTRGFVRALQRRLARHEVQLGHWTFLRILWERDGVTKRELSLEAGVMEPTTFVALRSMAALGYVTLEQRADNRKNVYVFLTPLGRRLKATLVPLAEEVNALALQGIDPAAVATTRQALLAMVVNLARDAADEAPPAPADARPAGDARCPAGARRRRRRRRGGLPAAAAPAMPPRPARDAPPRSAARPPAAESARLRRSLRAGPGPPPLPALRPAPGAQAARARQPGRPAPRVHAAARGASMRA